MQEFEDFYKRKLKEDLPDLNPPNKEKKTITISCPDCNEKSLAVNINLEKAICKCHSCNAVFSIDEELQKLKSSSPEEIDRRPEGIEVFEMKGMTEVSIEQPPPVYMIIFISLLPLILLICGGLYFKDGYQTAGIIGLMSAFAFVFFIVKLIKRYIRKDERVYFTMSDENLEIQWRPNAGKKDVRYKKEDIDQVYIKQTSEGMGLYFILKTFDGIKHEKILKGYAKGYKLKYLEQFIESKMGIPNKSVSGELK